jgi:Zn-dependent protease with chaperone function
MDHVYPAGPAAVPADLTKPTAAYRHRAWLAMGGLALFVVLYIALTGWFTWTAYRLLSSAFNGGDAFVGVVMGTAAAFLAVFMWKAVFFIQHRYEIDDIEVTAGQQPRLFAFINRLADEAGAPRAHRVFLTPHVNAAVFYDLSILNLLFPSRKNLKIGLGLVNALTLGEMKAVLAHEFGHFAQRSMAVGRWVYIAQQIAGHIIAKRDALDSFLRRLSRFDLRIAWVGWLLSLIIWSIRSLMETVFRVVVLAQRALSREMELQADLVAVSLTGSDALIHALHRLHAADEAWDRALNFAGSEAGAGRLVQDLFEVQRHITGKLRDIFDDPGYGNVAPLPPERPHEHRVFKTELAQPPRMWSTHPANSEREQNAKRTYIAAPIDERSAWELFDAVPALKTEMSAHVVRSEKAEIVPIEASLQKLDEQFNRAYLNRAYRGAYLGRSLTRHVKQPGELYNPPLKPDLIAGELGALYPESLAEELECLRSLEEEKGSLQALRDGFLTAPGGIIRHRGRELKRKDLQAAIDEVEDELTQARDKVVAHDRRCRSAHLAAAARLGKGWDTYLKGLLDCLHYAEHSEANLRDAQGALGNVFAVVTADGRVSGRELKRLIQSCAEAYKVLRQVHLDETSQVTLDRTLLRRMEVESWAKVLGEFNLPPPDESNIDEWLKVIDSWINSAASAMAGLRHASLEQLLLAESQVARFTRENMTPGAAPEATRVPAQYSLLLPGGERKRQKKLDLWDRFHVADGIVPTIARLTVACGIVAAVLGVGGAVGETSVTIYNGLGRPVSVTIGEATARLAPFGHTQLVVPPADAYSVRAASLDGEVIETFDIDIPRGSTNAVYNVASASPLLEWTAVYGSARPEPDRRLGATRWLTTDAGFVFEQPPESISTKGDGGSRDVLSGFGEASPDGVLSLVDDEQQRLHLIDIHARWDSSDSRQVAYWLSLATQLPDFAQILAHRLKATPHDVLTLRLEQDVTSGEAHAEVCQRHRSLSEAAPGNADLLYIATRCIGDVELRDRVLMELQQKFPQNGWIAQAAGYTFAEQGRWSDALAQLDIARKAVPSLASNITADVARLRRMLSKDGHPPLSDLLNGSEALQDYAKFESAPDALEPGAERAHHYLNRGQPDHAVEELAKGDGGADMRFVRLAAASDGASRNLITRALKARPDQGLDADSSWAALGLAIREHGDSQPYVEAIKEFNRDDAANALRFIESLQPGATPDEELLRGLHFRTRAQAYSAAVIILGRDAPQEWRNAANRLLFIGERPYFSAGDGRADARR